MRNLPRVAKGVGMADGGKTPASKPRSLQDYGLMEKGESSTTCAPCLGSLGTGSFNKFPGPRVPVFTTEDALGKQCGRPKQASSPLGMWTCRLRFIWD